MMHYEKRIVAEIRVKSPGLLEDFSIAVLQEAMTAMCAYKGWMSATVDDVTEKLYPSHAKTVINTESHTSAALRERIETLEKAVEELKIGQHVERCNG